MKFKSKEDKLMWESYMMDDETVFDPEYNHSQPMSMDGEDEDEEKKPDYLDFDKDGNIEEPMSSAIASAEGDEYGEEDFEDDDYGDEEKEVIMTFDTSEPVKPSLEVGGEDYDEDDHERNEMLKSEVKKLCEFANRLEEMCGSANFEEWMVAKITKAADYTSDVYFRLSAKADYANSGIDMSHGEY